MMTQSPLPAHDQLDFNFSSACTSPYVTAPSSPQRFFVGGSSSSNYFYTAPPRPGRISDDHDSSSENTSDFAFDFSGHLETPPTLSADELFYAGVIKPLQVPPQQPQRGRSSEATPKNKSSNAQQRKTSSLRVSDILLDGSKQSSTAWYCKWSLMFRSKSEGSGGGTKKKKWAVEKSNSEVDLKNASMRRKGMSSHELHYTENRAAAEEMRKKTPLPYKHVEQHGWLLGCLGFSPPNFDAASLLSRRHPHHSSY